MEDKKIVVDGVELIPVWRVLYQDAWRKRSGRGFWILENMAEGWHEMAGSAAIRSKANRPQSML